MKERIAKKIFDSYCYGPVDITHVYKGDNTLVLYLKDSVGRTAAATYHGCVYWRLNESHTGTHLSLVQQFSAKQLLDRSGSPTLTALKKNTDHVDQLLMEWENLGLSFYVHFSISPKTEYLIVAKSMDYNEVN